MAHQGGMADFDDGLEALTLEQLEPMLADAKEQQVRPWSVFRSRNRGLTTAHRSVSKSDRRGSSGWAALPSFALY